MLEEILEKKKRLQLLEVLQKDSQKKIIEDFSEIFTGNPFGILPEDSSTFPAEDRQKISHFFPNVSPRRFSGIPDGAFFFEIPLWNSPEVF